MQLYHNILLATGGDTLYSILTLDDSVGKLWITMSIW